jgi:hypothetical protein
MSTCVGYDLYYRYADGSCGTYDTFVESNSSSCGYVAPTPTPTSTPEPLPEGVLNFGSTDSDFQQCGFGYEPNDYEFNRTYYVNFTSPRNMGGYVVVYLSGSSTVQLPFNQNDTSAYLTVPCGCGSVCESIEYVMSITYVTPTSTPIPEPTSTPFVGGNDCFQGQSGAIYTSQYECELNDGPCSVALCPEGPQP